MFACPIFGAAMAQAVADELRQRRTHEANDDPNIIDVESRVVKDVPALPAPKAQP